jgi:integrase
MYYEKKSKKGTINIVYQSQTKKVALRVIINRKKYEYTLFSWPAEFWHNDTIIPRSKKDIGYADKIKHIIQVRENAIDVLNIPQVNDIQSFKMHFNKSAPLLKPYMVKFINDLSVSSSSKEAYSKKAKLILDAIGDIAIDQINESHLSDIDHAYSDKSKSTVAMCHSLLARVIKQGVIEKYISSSPYSLFKSSIKKKPERQPLVSKNDVDTLWGFFSASQDGAIKDTARLYLLQCYTGARYSDAIRLTNEHLKAGYYIAQKTGFNTPIYTSDKLLLLLKDQPLNINYSSYRYRLKLLDSLLGTQLYSSHAARRFFASTAYEKSNNIMLVKSMLGHTSASMTEKYVKTQGQKVKHLVAEIGKL